MRALYEQPPAFGALPEDEPGLAETRERLRESLDRCYFGAFNDGCELVGIVRFSRYSAANEKHRAYLAGLYVWPDCRGKGFGRALVQRALRRAYNTPGIRRVNLTVVTTQDAAVRLYISVGFRIYGTDLQAFSSHGVLYDEHLMTMPVETAT